MDHIREMESMEEESYEMFLKRRYFTESLILEGVVQSSSGKSLHCLRYEELKQEWINHQARNINIASDENRWF